MSAPTEEEEPRIHIRITGYDARVVEQAAKALIKVGQKHGVTIHGPIPLPTRHNRYTVAKAPDIHRPTTQRLTLRTHTRIIIFTNFTTMAVNELMSLTLPSSCNIEVKL